MLRLDLIPTGHHKKHLRRPMFNVSIDSDNYSTDYICLIWLVPQYCTVIIVVFSGQVQIDPVNLIHMVLY